MKRATLFIVLGAILLALAACAPVPRPFSAHKESNPLVDDQRVTFAVQIAPVAAFPGLAEAVVHALALQDVLASTHSAGPRTVLVKGAVENGALVWRLTTPDRRELGKVAQGTPRTADVQALARDATPLIVRLLTSDGGIPDGAGRPHIAVRVVQGPKGIDTRALSQAMADALAGQGLSVGNDDAIAAVDGELRVLPAGAGKDVVQVDWIVRDAKGASLGTISQGSPVDHAMLAGPLTELARDIAAAAAPGVLEVIRQKVPAALDSR